MAVEISAAFFRLLFGHPPPEQHRGRTDRRGDDRHRQPAAERQQHRDMKADERAGNSHQCAGNDAAVGSGKLSGQPDGPASRSNSNPAAMPMTRMIRKVTAGSRMRGRLDGCTGSRQCRLSWSSVSNGGKGAPLQLPKEAREVDEIGFATLALQRLPLFAQRAAPADFRLRDANRICAAGLFPARLSSASGSSLTPSAAIASA